MLHSLDQHLLLDARLVSGLWHVPQWSQVSQGIIIIIVYKSERLVQLERFLCSCVLHLLSLAELLPMNSYIQTSTETRTHAINGSMLNQNCMQYF